MNLLIDLEHALAVNYAILWHHLGDCSLMDGMRLISIALLVVLGIRMLLQALYRLRLDAGAHRVDPNQHGPLVLRYRQLSQAMGLRQPPPLFFYHHARLPAFTIGVFRPRVYLSPRFLNQLDDEERGAVLAHELSHVARRDNLVIWILESWFAVIPLLTILLLGSHMRTWQACVLLALLTIASMVGWRLCMRGWYKNRCEHACDDYAVGRGTPPLVLASSLIKAWDWMRTPDGAHARLPVLHALILGKTCLERRVTRLVDYQGAGMASKLERFGRVAGLMVMLVLSVFLFRFHAMGSYDHVVQAHAETAAVCPSDGGCSGH